MKIDTLQRYFNEWIRNRDKNPDGSYTCISCGKNITNIKQVHAGHWLPKQWFGWLRFDPDNVSIQCASCNYRDGEWLKYMVALNKKIGTERLNALIDRAMNKPKDFKWDEKKKDEVLNMIKDLDK